MMKCFVFDGKFDFQVVDYWDLICNCKVGYSQFDFTYSFFEIFSK